MPVAGGNNAAAKPKHAFRWGVRVQRDPQPFQVYKSGKVVQSSVPVSAGATAAIPAPATAQSPQNIAQPQMQQVARQAASGDATAQQQQPPQVQRQVLQGGAMVNSNPHHSQAPVSSQQAAQAQQAGEATQPAAASALAASAAAGTADPLPQHHQGEAKPLFGGVGKKLLGGVKSLFGGKKKKKKGRKAKKFGRKKAKKLAGSKAAAEAEEEEEEDEDEDEETSEETTPGSNATAPASNAASPSSNPLYTNTTAAQMPPELVAATMPPGNGVGGRIRNDKTGSQPATVPFFGKEIQPGRTPPRVTHEISYYDQFIDGGDSMATDSETLMGANLAEGSIEAGLKQGKEMFQEGCNSELCPKGIGAEE